MVKSKFITTFFCLLSLCLSVSAQKNILPYNIVCTYQLEYQTDSSDISSKKSELMLLMLGDNYSVFKSANQNLSDSIDHVPFEALNGDIAFKLLYNNRTNFRYSIIKDVSSELLTIDYIDINPFQYNESRNNFNWKILDETMKINTFVCQKAIADFGGRRWIAWFTTEVAISDGPYKFNGLPGLIVDIADEKNYYSFRLNSIERRRGEIFPTKKQMTALSKEKYYISLKYFLDNQFEIKMLAGSKVKLVDGGESIKKRLLEQRKKNNNPIELDMPH